MPLFPPTLQAYASSTRTQAGPVVLPGEEQPDTRTPVRFVWWVVGQQRRLVTINVVLALFWLLPGAVNPFLLGRVVDTGILPGDPAETLRWASLMVLTILIGVASDVAAHTIAVSGWLVAMYRVLMLVTRKVVQMGHVITRRVPTGEVLSVGTSDSDIFGQFAEVLGRAVAGLLSFLLVSALVLSESPRLGAVVLIAAPIMVLSATPLLRPMQRAQSIERERSSRLTGMATDIVAGLRILRGIGGEHTFGDNYANQSQSVRRAGVRTASWWAAVDALSVLLSGLLLVILTWLGTREVAAGQMSLGQLISFFGYAVFLVRPLQTTFEAAQKWTQVVVASRKTVGVLDQQPPWHDPADPQELRTGRIVDEASGFVAEPGELTVVVSAVPDDSAALCDRIGRYLPTDAEAVPSVSAEETRHARDAHRQREAERARIAAVDEERATRRWGVTIDGVDLCEIDLNELRRRVMVTDASSAVFAGSLQNLIDPHGRHTREQAEQALTVASGEDVWEAMPGGWQGHLDERGRGLSGGQRQRLVLARALLADPEVLVLVEPTSAVDAHTEARIAARLPGHRAGRTTILTTVSPLWLHHADRVVLLEEGRVTAIGRHSELLAENPAYRSIVNRSEVSA